MRSCPKTARSGAPGAVPKRYGASPEPHEQPVEAPPELLQDAIQRQVYQPLRAGLTADLPAQHRRHEGLRQRGYR